MSSLRESVARSAGGYGVVVGLGDSVEDLGGEDFVLEEGGGRWDGGREERGEMLGESGDFAGGQWPAGVGARGDVGPGGCRDGEVKREVVGGRVTGVHKAGTEW